MAVSLAKVARGGQRYYLDAVASGIEDHRPPGGEPDGTWLGGAASSLGLDGQVTAAQLEAVLAGAHPESGEVLSKSHSRVKVAGYDLVFAAPKSVSVLFALGEQAVAEQIRAGHRAAVAATVGYLEREAVRARRGSRSQRRAVATTGVIGAAFLHRTSRAPDPHLHTHVLVANLVQDLDGKWSALDARGLYLHSRTAGTLYRAHLRQELTERLSLSWARTAMGVIDIEGMDPVVVRAFSRRRADIEAALAEQHASSPKAAQLAALTTRPSKDLATSFESLVPHWRARAAAMGWGPEQLAAVGGRGTGPSTGPSPDVLGPALVGRDGLTAHRSSFSRQDAVRAVCDASLSGSRVAGAEALADSLLDSNLVRPVTGQPALRSADTVRRADGGLVWGGVDVPRWTTAELMAVEEQMVESAQSRRGERIGLAHPGAVDKALSRRPDLAGAPGQSVRALLSSGGGVVTVGVSTATLAGDGLDAAREAWEASGLVVVGTGPGPSSAARLEAASGIESLPLGELLSSRGPQSRDGSGSGLASVDVLVVDRAGIIDSRALDQLLEQAASARVKVVLVCDPRQVGISDTGGWRRLADGLGSVSLDSVSLDSVSRGGPERAPPEWRSPDQRLADRSVEPRALDTEQAVEMVVYPAGRSTVAVAASLQMAREQVVEDWWEARRTGPRATMVAPRPADVKVLNAMAGERLNAADEPARGTEVARPEPEAAVSARRARTMDLDRCLVLGDSQMLARAGWSDRAQAGAQLYVVYRGRRDQRLEMDLLDRMDRLADSLVPGRGPPVAGPPSFANLSLSDLASQREQLRGRLSAVAALLPPDPGPALAGLDQDRARAAAALSAARTAAQVLPRRQADGRRWGRWGRRPGPDAQLVRADPTSATIAVARWEAEVQRLDARHVELGAQTGQRAEWATAHGDDLADYRHLGTAIDRRERALARAAEASPPAYLVAEIGDRPANPTDRVAWRKAARRVESYRERWGVRASERVLDDPTSDLARYGVEANRGPGPTREPGLTREVSSVSRRAEREEAASSLETARLALHRGPSRILERSAGRGLG